MNGCPVKAALFALALTLAGGGVAAPAWGQAGSAPIRLLPPADRPAPTPAPEQADPAPRFAPPPPISSPPISSPPAAAAEEPQRSSVFGPEVQVRPLGTVDPSSSGLIYPQNGGFPPDLWRGSTLSTVQPLIGRIPVSRSPAMQLMSQRLLFSAAEVPSGSFEGPSLLEARVERALALGRLAEVEGLARLAGKLGGTGVQRRVIESRFYDGVLESACAAVAELMLEEIDEETLKANAFCRAAGGDRAGAELSGALLREQGVKDGGFFGLLAAQWDAGAKLEGVNAKSALHLAMLRKARRPILPEYVAEASPGGLWALAEMQAGPPALMLLAAERAMALGVLLPQDLARAYGAVAFSPADLGNPVNAAKALGDARGNALLFQAASASAAPGQRLEMVNHGYRAFAADHGRVQAARVYGDLLRGVPPAPEFAWAGQHAVRILLASGDLIGARAWHNLLYAVSTAERQGAALTAAMLQLVDPEAPFRPQDWLDYWLSVKGQGLKPEDRDTEAALLLTLLDALGYEVPLNLWQRLYARAPSAETGARAASPLLLRGLQAAAGDGRLGETVLFSLLALGTEGPGKADATTLATVIAGLRKVGLERDARAVAYEAALMRGL